MVGRSLLRSASVLLILFGLHVVLALSVTVSSATAAPPEPERRETLAAPQETYTWITGTIRFSDRSLCHYNSSFFKTKVYPILQQLDDAGTWIGNTELVGATSLGLYEMPILETVTTTTQLRVTCEGTVWQRALTPEEIAGGVLDIVLPNKKPLANPIAATLGGSRVLAVPAGSTVRASVAARDPDGDPLHYRWGASDGDAIDQDAPETTWTLPASRGLHFLYVLVSDGKGGYEEKTLALSTDAGTVLAPPLPIYLPLLMINRAWTSAPALASASTTDAIVAAKAAAPALKPSDHTPANDHFLTYPALTSAWRAPADEVIAPLDDRVSACNYYRDLGVIGGCTPEGRPTGSQLTFSAWKADWGFGLPGNNEARAKYANLADLNLQRDMHTLSKSGIPRPGGGTGTDVASYVCNYPNTPADPALGNVLHDNNLVACVAFEYSVGYNPTTTLPYNGGLPFTKFLTFGPTGDLLLSVNLDGRGEKYIPGACVACHGGAGYTGRYGEFPDEGPNLRAQFIPYDLDNYAFSNQPGFSRAEQDQQLRRLNEFVLDTGPYSPTVELIHGWYDNPLGTFDGDFAPPAWEVTPADSKLYHAVIKPQCRMCHLALDPTGGLGFATPADIKAWDYYIGSRVCGVGFIPRYLTTMPNAKETFDRFWNSIGGLPGVDQPATLLAYLNALDPTITTCALPSWLP